MKIRKRLAAVTAAALVGGSLTMVFMNMADAAAPTRILNDTSSLSAALTADATFIETQSTVDNDGVRTIFATFLVEHAAGRRITGVRMDNDFNGTTDAGTLFTAAANVNSQFHGSGTTNFLETSRVTFNADVGTPGGFGTNTPRKDVPVRFRVQDDIGGQSASVSMNLHVVDNDNNTGFLGAPDGAADYPRMKTASQSTGPEVLPAASMNFSFSCDDVDLDVFSSDDDCDGARPRWRKLDDGSTITLPDINGMNDNAAVNVTYAAPSAQGYYVLEAQLRNENGSYPDTGNNSGGWWRIGSAVVNAAASSLSNTFTFTGASLSSPPSVNPGGTIPAVANPVDAGGSVQEIEWDADDSGSYERREYTVPFKNAGGDVEHPALTAAERTQTISVATPGVKEVNIRITDNGALDAADNVRRQAEFTGTIRVNAIPTATNVTAATDEDTAVPVLMSGNDPDNQPVSPLEYVIDTPPTAAQGTLGPVSGNVVTFTPALNFNGTATFTYHVRDGNSSTVAAHADSNIATATITVDPVNDPPIANGQTLTTQEDSPLNITLTSSDVDGGPPTYTTTDPPNGSISGSGASITYTPDLNYNGPDSFSFTVNDGAGGTDTGMVNITVTAVQDGPVAGDQTLNTQEDTALPVTLTGSDVDGDPLTFCCVTDPPNGSITGTAPNLVYTPDLNFNGTDSFDFTVDDGNSNTDVGTVTVNVTAVNDAPVADDQAVETAEDTPLSVTLTASDIDGDALTYTVTGGPSHGTLAGSPPFLVYTPALNYFGPDSFTFLVDDGAGGTDTGTIAITVTPVNDPPVADDQAVSTGEDGPRAIQLTASDVDNTEAQLTYAIDTPPANGTLSGSPPNIVYTPGLNYTGPDQFTFTVYDGEFTDTGTIDITVGPRNDPPVADPQAVSTDEDTPLAITLSGNDADGDSLTYSVTSGPSNGTLAGTPPNVTYTPALDFVGHDAFTFQADDGNGGLDTAVVDITVGGLNDPPVADPQAVTTNEDEPIAINLTGSDVDGDALTISPASAPVNGTLTGSGNFVIYSPGLNFNGSDEFTFLVSDGNGGTDTATVSITVNAVNDEPDAQPQIVNTPEDTAVAITLAGVDADGDALTYSITGPPSNGTLSGTAPNVTYTPNPDYNGADFFTFAVSDGNGGSDTATVSINVAAAPLIGTYIVPDGAVANVQIELGVPLTSRAAFLRFSSHLFAADGTPLAGRTLTFSTGTSVVCSGVTDASGFATCGTRIDALGALLNLGYQVNFVGDADYTASSAAGPIVVVNVIRI